MEEKKDNKPGCGFYVIGFILFIVGGALGKSDNPLLIALGIPIGAIGGIILIGGLLGK